MQNQPDASASGEGRGCPVIAVRLRFGRAGLAHGLAVLLGSAAAAAQALTDVGLGDPLPATLAGGLLMEGAAFLAERMVIK